MEAVRAARRVLIELLHWVTEELAGRPTPARVWVELAAQLRFLEDVAVFGAARVGRWEWDVAADELHLSAELAGIVGDEPASPPDRLDVFLARLRPADALRVGALMAAAMRDGEPFEYEAGLLRPDGALVRLRVRGAVLRDAEGRPVRVVGSAVELGEDPAAP
jgi:PAS domain-containing protein